MWLIPGRPEWSSTPNLFAFRVGGLGDPSRLRSVESQVALSPGYGVVPLVMPVMGWMWSAASSSLVILTFLVPRVVADSAHGEASLDGGPADQLHDGGHFGEWSLVPVLGDERVAPGNRCLPWVCHQRRIDSTAYSDVSAETPTLTHPSMFVTSNTPYGIAFANSPSARSGRSRSFTSTGSSVVAMGSCHC